MTAQPRFVETRTAHRLALGIEPIDAVTGRPSGHPVEAGLPLPGTPPPLPDGLIAPPEAHAPPGGPVVPLDGVGHGRFVLRHNSRRDLWPTPRAAELRILLRDPQRRYVPRLLTVSLWRRRELEDAETAGTPVPVLARTLRPWLLPGSAYPLPRGTTAVRGTVRTPAGAPVPWARLEAVISGTPTVAGRAHGDERGEFLLIVAGLGDAGLNVENLPVIELDVRVRARRPPPSGVPEEAVPRADVPDTPLLRGEIPPPGYVASPPRTLRISVGRLHAEPLPFPFPT
ncbi:carboxypeptidase regulatory-like domain-containing protein [Nonomuraea zeae]|uniref:Carboxypeptidase regulatory-like domain-containing protein n=1 Tax=Nonomuraea zeae TaxID=1642303 RepID=A0A5S4GUV2_9ACTN|nr:carboxypeptidase regulatory-like domain-containing protein [Nonomuraea zeae]TMR36244.1 carboxypeptidase regulatory-like domain-containing protein [Nonomuraea zeae]